MGYLNENKKIRKLDKFNKQRLKELINFLTQHELDLNLKIEESKKTLTKIEIEISNSNQEILHKFIYTLKKGHDNEIFYEKKGFSYQEKTMCIERSQKIPHFGREAFALVKRDFLTMKLFSKNFDFKML